MVYTGAIFRGIKVVYIEQGYLMQNSFKFRKMDLVVWFVVV